MYSRYWILWLPPCDTCYCSYWILWLFSQFPKANFSTVAYCLVTTCYCSYWILWLFWPCPEVVTISVTYCSCFHWNVVNNVHSSLGLHKWCLWDFQILRSGWSPHSFAPLGWSPLGVRHWLPGITVLHGIIVLWPRLEHTYVENI